MRKTIFILIMLLFGFCTIGFSDTIYLKTGGKIEGEIVGETQDKIIVKVVIGTITVERDTIEKIEVTEVAVEEIQPPTIPQPASAMKPIEIEPGSPAEAYLKWIDMVSKAEDPDDFTEYLSEKAFDEMMQSISDTATTEDFIKLIKTFTAKDVLILNQEIEGDSAHLVAEGTTWMGRARGEIEMVFEGGAWKVEGENWESGGDVEVMTEAPAPKGFGSLSGRIILPDLPERPKAGNLFITLQTFGEMQPSMYKEIPLSEITTETISYGFDNVPAGECYISAIFDVAEPYIDLEKTKKEAEEWGMQIDNLAAYIFGQDGDYSGNYEDSIVMEDAAVLTGIDFECTQRIGLTSLEKEEEYGTDYSLSNLRLVKDSPEGPRLLVDVTNNEEDKEIAQVNLMVFMNGWMTNCFRTGTGFIKPGETIEFEIIEGWDDFTLSRYYTNPANINLPKNRLSVHVVSSENGSHCYSVIEMPDETVAKFDVDKVSSGYQSEPMKWGIPYKVIDVRRQVSGDGTKEYYLEAKNESDTPIESFQIFLVVGGGLYNVSHIGPDVFNPYEENEFNITSGIDYCLKDMKKKGQSTDKVVFRVINKENDGYFEKLIEP